MRQWVFLSVLLFCIGKTGRAAAFECTALGPALVEHSCFHATFGPFVGVRAGQVSARVDELPRVDDVHTYYEIELASPREQNSVSYRVAAPDRAGEWAFFHDPDVALQLVDETGQVVPEILTQNIADCPALARASIFHLEDRRYRINLGPGNQARCVLVIENLGDFTARAGKDSDGDGFGTRSDTTLALCSPEQGYVANVSDCDDTRSDVNSAATEICDGVDQNCNGIADDEGLPCRAGKGLCEQMGTWRCVEAGASPTCVVAVPRVAQVEECDGVDADCDGTDDLEEEGLCDASDAPRCVNVLGKVRCGCDADVDCGSATSGRICDESTRECVDGCIDVQGRTGCPGGLVCTSTDPAAVGQCQDEQASKHAPAQADAGGEGPREVASSGCACKISERSSSGMGGYGFYVAVLVLSIVARRRSGGLS